MTPRAFTALALLPFIADCDDTPGRLYTRTDAALARGDVPDAEPPGPSGIGITCTDTRDQTEVLHGCRGGQFCFTSAAGFPAGYCSQDCRATPCPADSYCVADGPQQYCLLHCTDDSQCRIADGYLCVHPSAFLPRGCVPDPAPVGHAPGGGGCYASGADAGGASLPAVTFHGDAASVSHGRGDSDSEAEPTLAVSPTDGTVAVAYMAQDIRGNFFTGVSHLDPGATVWAMDGTVTDHDYDNALSPVIVYDRAGGLHMTWLGQSIERPQPALRLGQSLDHGHTWGSIQRIEPAAYCNGGCDPPWLALGPGTDAAHEALYVAWITRTTRRDGWVAIQRSTDLGGTFDPVMIPGRVETDGMFTLDPMDPRLTVGPEGSVHVAWVLQSRSNARAALGDTHNAVRYARSVDGIQAFSTPVAVSLPAESVVVQPPVLAAMGSPVYVLYVSGTPDGQWDLVLAATTDEGAHWTRRRVNDEPGRCATHGFAALAADPTRGVLHVVWLDNRFGDGEVAYARCPASPSAPCSPNESVSGVPFRFSTSTDPTLWHGSHAALTVARDGTLWTAWSDTRTGGPAIYVARSTPAM